MSELRLWVKIALVLIVLFIAGAICYKLVKKTDGEHTPKSTVSAVSQAEKEIDDFDPINDSQSAIEASGSAIETENDKFTSKKVKIGRTPFSLDGMLYIPKDRLDATVAIIIPEEGSDLEGTVGKAQNKPTLDLAKGLAENGVATLFYESRTKKYNHVLAKDAGTFTTIIDDAWHAIDYAYNAKGVDSSRIVLIGKGKSGNYMPSIVEKKERRLSGAVLLGAKPIKAIESEYAKEKNEVVNDAKYFIEKNSTFPLYILQGEADFENPEDTMEQWQKLFKGRSHIQYKLCDKLNHHFIRTSGELDRSDYDSKGKMSYEVIKSIAEWIKKQSFNRLKPVNNSATNSKVKEKTQKPDKKAKKTVSKKQVK